MKKSLVVVLSVSLLVLTVSGLSYSYFKNYGITKEEHLSVVAKKLAVIFTDNSELTGEIYPGYEETKTFSVENKSESLFKYNIVFEDLVNTFETEGFLQYKITSEDGGFNCDWTDIPKSNEPTDTILAYSVEIENGKKHNYKLEIRYQNSETEDQSADMGKVLSGNLAITEGTTSSKFMDKLLADNKKIGTRSDFSVAYGEAGLYKETDSKYLETDGRKYGVVYYFAGDTQDNWVKFGKEGNNDIWWRIIRTNENGSVRLLYAGKGDHNTQTGYINASQKYNSSYNNTKYVGYMYGNTEGTEQTLETDRKNETNSDIKTTIDNWYTTNMNTLDTQGHSYGSYLSRTAIYCNDRSTHKYAASSTMYYGAAMRLTTNASNSTYGGVSNATSYHPTFKCGGNADGTGLWDNGGDVADKFTGKNGNGIGNEALKDSPIALMTADEVSYAGGIYESNSENTYYYKNSAGTSVTGSTYWWTMSPSYASSSGHAYVFFVYGSDNPGRLDRAYVGYSDGVRPVVSLKSCVSVSGSGKTDDPYIPSIDSACAQADN